MLHEPEFTARTLSRIERISECRLVRFRWERRGATYEENLRSKSLWLPIHTQIQVSLLANRRSPSLSPEKHLWRGLKNCASRQLLPFRVILEKLLPLAATCYPAPRYWMRIGRAMGWA